MGVNKDVLGYCRPYVMHDDGLTCLWSKTLMSLRDGASYIALIAPGSPAYKHLSLVHSEFYGLINATLSLQKTSYAFQKQKFSELAQRQMASLIEGRSVLDWLVAPLPSNWHASARKQWVDFYKRLQSPYDGTGVDSSPTLFQWDAKRKCMVNASTGQCIGGPAQPGALPQASTPSKGPLRWDASKNCLVDDSGKCKSIVG